MDSEQELAQRTLHIFVGRDAEVAELSASLDDAIGGRGRLFLIAGEPGIGKTMLAERLAVRALERGARVLWGGCWEGPRRKERATEVGPAGNCPDSGGKL